MALDDDQAVQGMRQLRGRAFLGSRVPPIARHSRQVDRVTWQYPRVIAAVHAQLPSLQRDRSQEGIRETGD